MEDEMAQDRIQLTMYSWEIAMVPLGHLSSICDIDSTYWNALLLSNCASSSPRVVIEDNDRRENFISLIHRKETYYNKWLSDKVVNCKALWKLKLVVFPTSWQSERQLEIHYCL